MPGSMPLLFKQLPGYWNSKLFVFNTTAVRYYLGLMIIPIMIPGIIGTAARAITAAEGGRHGGEQQEEEQVFLFHNDYLILGTKSGNNV
jgi:hypothetical protein